MPSTCEFQLSNPNAVYFSGETITGTIILTTTSSKDVRDIRLLFRGEAKVSWSETERRRNSDGTYSDHTIEFKGNTLYVRENILLAGEGTLAPGTYRYDVQVHLPLACPTSLEGRYGHIRYELTFKLNRPFRFDNVFTKPLTIIRTVDLNLFPDLKIPLEDEEVFQSCCCLCPGGNINAKLTLPYGGYANGQRIYYTLYIKNQSMDDISGYSVEFSQTIKFTAQRPRHKSRSDKTVLYENYFNTPCLRLSTRLFKGGFTIPTIPPSSEGDSIINVYYNLKVTFFLGSCTPKKVMKVPLVIGTVPIRESLLPPTFAEATASNPLIEVTPTAPQIAEADDNNADDLPPSYKDLGPPSFEEATRSHSPFVDIDIDEQHRYIGFRPLYPMYSQSDE